MTARWPRRSTRKAECIRNPVMRPNGDWKSVGDVEGLRQMRGDGGRGRRRRAGLYLIPLPFRFRVIALLRNGVTHRYVDPSQATRARGRSLFGGSRPVKCAALLATSALSHLIAPSDRSILRLTSDRGEFPACTGRLKVYATILLTASSRATGIFVFWLARRRLEPLIRLNGKYFNNTVALFSNTVLVSR
jgi:hypothetical protein